MTFGLAFGHLLGFCMPAIFFAIVMPLLAPWMRRFFKLKKDKSLDLRAGAAMHFIVCLSVLLVGLLLTQTDGKMLTYLSMVTASAVTQWIWIGAHRV